MTLEEIRKIKPHTIIALVEDRPGVLNRITSKWRQRSFNIESLSVGHSEKPGLSRMTFVVDSDANADQVVKQLDKLIDIVDIRDISHEDIVAREMAIIKVRAGKDQRSAIIDIAEVFKAEVLDHWKSDVPIARTLNPNAPTGWKLEKALFATPTIVLFDKGQEISRYTGYNGDTARFWKWLGFRLLTPEQQKIAFEQGTERAFTGSHLDEKRPGYFVDPITGAPLFRSDTKFDSGTGWPSFFNPVPGSITLHEDNAHGMRRVEVRSASSGIHLGHVFDDGPPPTGKRYCINGNVLKFVPDKGK